MTRRTIPRRAASFVFGFATVGLAAIAAGLIGFQLRTNYGPNTRPLGYWTGGVVWEQILVGAVCIGLASAVFYKVNRDL